MKKILLSALLALLILSCKGFHRDHASHYVLDITKQIIKNDEGMTLDRYLINDTSPGPVLKASKDDILSIEVNNRTDVPLILHWHGVMVPNSQDGVAGVTGPAIRAGGTFTYEFMVKQTGTYWYHAHGLEEAEGIFGGIIFTEHKHPLSDDPLILFSGQLKDTAANVLQSLNPGASADHTTMHSGHEAHEMDMPPMDSQHQHGEAPMMEHFSDVSYAKHYINGRSEPFGLPVSGDSIKLRLVNAYVDGFINLVYSGGDIEVVAADGLAIKPVKVQNLRMAMGETYDVILPANPSMSYELVSFFMGETSYSKLIIGDGNLLMLASYNSADHPSEQSYNKFETEPNSFIAFNDKAPAEVINLELAGDHDTYNWAIMRDGQPISAMDLKKGEKIRFTITNNTMMPHPMHMHGTFFKVVSQPHNLIKHTMNLDPMESMELEFTIDEEGKWLFHCHNLFHMASGMMITMNVV